jgi:hypothetical protein
MITIVHGDDVLRSREFFLAEKGKSKESVSFDKEINLSDLTQIVEGGSLFATPKDVFIENFFSSKKSNSNEFKEIAGFILAKTDGFNFFFWEGKSLERGPLLLFKNAVLKNFNLPQSLFSFLDGIKPNSIDNIKFFHDAITNINEEIVLHMLVRQFRLLLAISNPSENPIDEVKRLAPWQRSKLSKQANLFGETKLSDAFKKLHTIDSALKSGRIGLSLVQAIDTFLLKI